MKFTKHKMNELIASYREEWHGAKDMQVTFTEDLHDGVRGQVNGNSNEVVLNLNGEWGDEKDFESTLVHEHFGHIKLHDHWGQHKRHSIFEFTLEANSEDFQNFKTNYYSILGDYWTVKVNELVKIKPDLTISERNQHIDHHLADEYFAYCSQLNYESILNTRKSKFLNWLNDKLIDVHHPKKLIAFALIKYRFGSS